MRSSRRLSAAPKVGIAELRKERDDLRQESGGSKWCVDGERTSRCGPSPTHSCSGAAHIRLVEFQELRTSQCPGVWRSQHHLQVVFFIGQGMRKVGSFWHHRVHGHQFKIRLDGCFDHGWRRKAPLPSWEGCSSFHDWKPSDLTESRYGLRGVRVGEASHPGPVQTRHARRLQSTLVDSDAFTAEEGTQIDLEDDTPMICGRLSPSSGATPHVHVCHAHTGGEDSLRVASRAVPSSTAQGRDGVARKVASVSDNHSPSNSQQRVGCVGGGFVWAWRIVKCHPEGSQVRSSYLTTVQRYSLRGVRMITMWAGTQLWRRTAKMICL